MDTTRACRGLERQRLFQNPTHYRCFCIKRQTIFTLSFRKRTHNKRHEDDIQMGSDWVADTNSNTGFENPTFYEDLTYDSISTATGSLVAEKIKQANEDDDTNGMCNPTYDLAFSTGHQIEDPETRCASLQGKKDDYMKPVDSQFEFPHRAETGDDGNEKVKGGDESQA